MSFRRGCISLENVKAEELMGFLERANKVSQSLELRGNLKWLDGKLAVLYFQEDSTRTRMSFEIAARRLGASVSVFSSQGSSASKGETILDTLKNIEAMNPHALVIRTPVSGIPFLVSKELKIPVINAGDGFHEHPTQALLDLFTIRSHFKKIEGLRITIVGDIAHSRVARSNMYALKALGAEITFCGPPTMIPPQLEKLGVKVTNRLDQAIDGAHVVMMLRIQTERHLLNQIPSHGEYAKFFCLRPHHLARLDSQAIIMHPGPVNRGVEIDSAVLDGERSVVLSQVNNGVAVRALILTEAILGDLPYELT